MRRSQRQGILTALLCLGMSVVGTLSVSIVRAEMPETLAELGISEGYSMGILMASSQMCMGKNT